MASDAVAGTTSSGPSDGSRFAWPAASAAPHTDAAFSGKYQIGCQPSASSAAISTFLGPSAATKIGIRSRTGWLISFSGLPSPVAWAGGGGVVQERPDDPRPSP